MDATRKTDDSLLDPLYCNFLLAQYEKNRAIENSTHIDYINTPEYQQYLATFGNQAMQHISHKLEQKERDLQLQYDLKLAEICKKPAHSINQLRYLHGYLTQKTFFDYVTALRASNELATRINKTHEENESLMEELKRLSSQLP